MTVRKAQAGIYLSRTREGLAKEIADWAEGTCDNGQFGIGAATGVTGMATAPFEFLFWFLVIRPLR
jgi:hypothetical protein